MSRFHYSCQYCDRVYGFDRDPAGKWLCGGGGKKFTQIPGALGFFGQLFDFVNTISSNTTDSCA